MADVRLAAYEALEPWQQKEIDDLMLYLRPNGVDLVHFFDILQDIDSFWRSTGQTAIGRLAPADFIPNKTGMAQAQSISQNDVNVWMQTVAALLTSDTSSTRTVAATLGGVSAGADPGNLTAATNADRVQLDPQ